jgi:hypothetical protein
MIFDICGLWPLFVWNLLSCMGKMQLGLSSLWWTTELLTLMWHVCGPANVYSECSMACVQAGRCMQPTLTYQNQLVNNCSDSSRAEQYASWTRLCLGLARTIYIRFVYGIFGRKITKYTFIYSAFIRFRPTLIMLVFTYQKGFSLLTGIIAWMVLLLL